MEAIQESLSGLVHTAPAAPMSSNTAVNNNENNTYTSPTRRDLAGTEREQLAVVIAERDDFAHRLDRAEHELEVARVAHDELLAEIHRGASSKSNSRPPLLRGESSKSFDVIRQLKEQLRMALTEADERAAEVDDISKAELAGRRQVTVLNAKIRQLEAEADDVKRLRDELDVWKARAAEGTAHAAEVTRYRHKLEDFEALKVELSEIRNQNDALSEEVASLRTFEHGANAMQEQFVVCERELETALAEVATLKREHGDSVVRLRQRDSMLARLEGDKQAAEQTVEVLRAELEDAVGNRASQHADDSEAAATIRALRSKLAEEQVVSARSSTAEDTARKQLAEAEAENAGLRSELTAVKNRRQPSGLDIGVTIQKKKLDHAISENEVGLLYTSLVANSAPLT